MTTPSSHGSLPSPPAFARPDTPLAIEPFQFSKLSEAPGSHAFSTRTTPQFIGGGDIQIAAFDHAGGAVASRHRHTGLRTLIVRIENFESGAGKYAGHLLFGNTTATAAANLALPEGLIDTANNNALVVNLLEGAVSHLLPLQSIHTGVYAGMTAESTPRAIVLVQNAGPVLQPVQITRSGGADGTQTAPATWTYNLLSLDGTQTLATAVALARPRPNGSMVTAASSPAFGLAFVDSTATWRLWDAGEVAATTACT